MTTIEVTTYKKETALFIQCFEPFTKLSMYFDNFRWLKTPVEKNTQLPYDRIWLKAIVKTCQGASMKQIEYEELSLSGWEVDERYDFILTLTPENILALKATCFDWSKNASIISASFPVSIKSIRSLQNKAINQLIMSSHSHSTLSK